MHDAYERMIAINNLIYYQYATFACAWAIVILFCIYSKLLLFTFAESIAIHHISSIAYRNGGKE